MDLNIGFDPNKLSNKEKTFIKAKLDLTYDGEDSDGCKVFNLKQRYREYPRWWIGFKRCFGKKRRVFNPCRIVYSLEHGVALFKKSDMKISHLCGYVLCLNSNHLIQESYAYNVSRRTCHASRGIPWVCQHVPQCIIKTVNMKK